MWDLIVSVPDHCLSFYFEKAFDTSSHELLKSKLLSYASGGKTLKWTDSFLCFR